MRGRSCSWEMCNKEFAMFYLFQQNKGGFCKNFTITKNEGKIVCFYSFHSHSDCSLCKKLSFYWSQFDSGKMRIEHSISPETNEWGRTHAWNFHNSVLFLQSLSVAIFWTESAKGRKMLLKKSQAK